MEFLAVSILATVLVVLALGVLPRKMSALLPPRSGSLVYRDQLQALDREVAAGAIPVGEAQSLRIELSRRLLDASKQVGEVPALPAVSPLLFALFIPLIVLPLYWHFGSIAMHDAPLAPRLANAVANNDYEAMLAQVEKHLAEKPDDVAGWKVAAPAYAQLGRYQDAADAYLKIASLSPPTAELLTSHGEMLTLANKGMITKLAAQSFAQALALDPTYPKARFFAALALQQEGKLDEAKAAYEKLLADAPADAPWRGSVESELAAIAAHPPALTDQQVKEGTAQSPADQNAMIRAMVDGLEQKLNANPDDLEGWLKLIRARMVLGEVDKASAARDKALAHYGENALVLKAIANLSAEIGLK